MITNSDFYGIILPTIGNKDHLHLLIPQVQFNHSQLCFDIMKGFASMKLHVLSMYRSYYKPTTLSSPPIWSLSEHLLSQNVISARNPSCSKEVSSRGNFRLSKVSNQRHLLSRNKAIVDILDVYQKFGILLIAEGARKCAIISD